jgi:plasmid stabilization system protein ParE
MTFRVEIALKAAYEIEVQYEWIAKRSLAAAKNWRGSLLKAIDSLELNPDRCRKAPEADCYHGLRQLLHGKRQRHYRILFEIRGNTVVILRVRHPAQDLLKANELLTRP